MSIDQSRPDPVVVASAPIDDGRTPLVLAAGLIAAIVAGGIWAGLVVVTNREIGFVAWGVGLLVGLAMSQVTAQRTRQLAYAAAAFAVIGLLAGKIFIFSTFSSSFADALADNEDVLRGAVAWHMYDDDELDAETMAAIDAVEMAGDTLPDALWVDMLRQGSTRLATMSEDEKRQIAAFFADEAVNDMGLIGGIIAQLSLFDALWLFLAVGTAYRMMAPEDRPAVAHSEQKPMAHV